MVLKTHAACACTHGPLPGCLLFLPRPAGRQLFAEALANGHMTGFFKLMEQFRCGAGAPTRSVCWGHE